jgi:hypothetical protein
MSQFGGSILIAFGTLIAGLSGLCSLSIFLSSGEFSGWGMWPIVAVIGGIPFAIGAGLIWWGWSVIRRARRQRNPDVDKISGDQ